MFSLVRLVVDGAQEAKDVLVKAVTCSEKLEKPREKKNLKKSFSFETSQSELSEAREAGKFQFYKMSA